MVGAYHKALQYKNSLKKKGCERVNFILFYVLTTHKVIFKGEDYITNYINTWWHGIFGNMILSFIWHKMNVIHDIANIIVNIVSSSHF
jgi:hypothetical protein